MVGFVALRIAEDFFALSAYAASAGDDCGVVGDSVHAAGEVARVKLVSPVQPGPRGGYTNVQRHAILLG